MTVGANEDAVGIEKRASRCSGCGVDERRGTPLASDGARERVLSLDPSHAQRVATRLGAPTLMIGAVGASGDSSDNDERVVLAGIQAAGLIGDPGAD